MSNDKIVSLVPPSEVHKSEYINPLDKHINHDLSECLKELKFGRPATAQKLIDTMIAMAKREEKERPTKFDISSIGL